MFKPSAKVITDSLNIVTGDRLTTMIIKHHRFVHSEFMTHRVLSRNSSSSRAIPVNKQIQNLIDDAVYPLYWGKNQKGMQAGQELSENEINQAAKIWDSAKQNAINTAKTLIEMGVHKQIVNRLLEPFSTITVIVSATEWTNFFSQRCHKDAQPEIQALAYQMQKAYQESQPRELQLGEWHLPLIRLEDYTPGVDKTVERARILKISTGRCARVSYLNHEGVRDVNADIDLHDKLLSSAPAHLSPFEHQAVATGSQKNLGNFRGFQQYRKMVESTTV